MKVDQKIAVAITGLNFILLIPNIFKWINDTIKCTKDLTLIPIALEGYVPFILFSIGVFSSIIGGAIWGIIWKTIGDKGEPHGKSSIGWGIITNITTILMFIFIGIKLFSVPFSNLMILSISLLIGFSIGSWIFYSLPLRTKGLRKSIEEITQKQTKRNKLFWSEFWLALIWSLILSIPSFLLFQVAKYVLYQQTISRLLITFLKQTTLIIGSNCLVIWCFIIIYPSIRKHAMARGLIAGITLRTTLFMALFINLI